MNSKKWSFDAVVSLTAATLAIGFLLTLTLGLGAHSVRVTFPGSMTFVGEVTCVEVSGGAGDLVRAVFEGSGRIYNVTHATGYGIGQKATVSVNEDGNIYYLDDRLYIQSWTEVLNEEGGN